jgi:microcompartment protein CcmK/EutM
MKLGRVMGKVWATVKDPKLNNCTFYIMQPVDEDENPLGMQLVAVDTVSSREGRPGILGGWCRGYVCF